MLGRCGVFASWNDVSKEVLDDITAHTLKKIEGAGQTSASCFQCQGLAWTTAISTNPIIVPRPKKRPMHVASEGPSARAPRPEIGSGSAPNQGFNVANCG